MYLYASCLLLFSNFFHFAQQNKRVILLLLHSSPSYSSNYKYSKPMMQRLAWCCLLLFIVVAVATSARPLVDNQGGYDKLHQVMNGDSSSMLEEKNSIDQLMGLEACDKKDEDCIKRRLLSEAHLDYIYTQQQKP